MKTVILTITIALSLNYPAYSQGAVMSCEMQPFDEYIPVGKTFPVNPEPAHIDGSNPGSRVNVRTGPGMEYEISTYGLVENSVEVIGQAFSTTCETWVQVRLPRSENIGWIRSDFIRLYYQRGWWT
jgi:hypothetical protein